MLGLDDSAIVVIWDATYVYIQKSSNYNFQRCSFSMHKGRNLVKMMIVVSSTGHIVECYGPYFTNGGNNDASIIIDQFEQHKINTKNFFKENDAFVVDRGFRDCVDFLAELGFNVYMPNFLYNGSQHSDMEANNSRLITKIRWVIEALNGIIKQWKYFANVVPNKNIPFIEKDFKIVCSLINRYYSDRVKSDAEKESVIAKSMLSKLNLKNTLKDEVEGIKRTKKQTVHEDPRLIDFPSLSEEYLLDLGFGTYQMKQAYSYVMDHLNERGKYKFEFSKDKPNILKVKIKSRHSGQTVYKTYIDYSNSDSKPIKRWYCTCKSGARTLGVCAHVMSVLWYMGYCLKNNNLKPKESSKWVEYILDATNKISPEPEEMDDEI